MITGTQGFGLLSECELTEEQFRYISGVLHKHAGIRMPDGKQGLVRARLTKRLRALGLVDFDSYLDLVTGDPTGREFREMVDVLTTNKTSFLREAAHFDYLRDIIFPQHSGPLRLWSAGCSTGEEPYTLAMLCNDRSPDCASNTTRILATDISHRVLERAKAGTYPADDMAAVPSSWLRQYWTAARDAHGRDVYEAGNSLRQLVQFARLNLMDRWPMQGPFDAIFCRNVMIYFDKATQQQLVQRYWALLRPGGHLFVGHSESLTGLSHRFRYVQPAVYVR